MMANDVTHRRLKESLQAMKSKGLSENRQLYSVLFGESEPRFASRVPITSPFNPNLNPSQLEAISFAMSSKDVALIHGPPGTGKTTTIVELVLQFLAKNQKIKILVCAGSNVAVDNVVEKLARWISQTKSLKRRKFLRLGHPARLLPQVLEHSLDAQISRDEGSEIVSDVRKEMNEIVRKMGRTKNKSERYRMRNELGTLRKELQKREKKVVDELVKGSDVILTTSVGSADRLLNDMAFDVVIIDEAAQSIEASCWIPILKLKGGNEGGPIILAGDPCQLGPTIKSVEAAKGGLEKTLFDRLQTLYPGDKITNMLEIQYRMNENIMIWPSNQLYGGRLSAHESVRTHLLSQLENVNNFLKEKSSKKDEEMASLPTIPLLLIDTSGSDFEEQEGPEGESKSNINESQIVVKHVEQLLAVGVKPEEIAVISPYNAQVALIKKTISHYSQIEVGSVDGFQGREKEAIIISFVRSNKKGEVGFLSENRRTNVAITRARRHLCLIGDSDTLSKNPFLKDLIDYVNEKGENIDAQEYLSLDVPFVLEKLDEGEFVRSNENDIVNQLLKTTIESTPKKRASAKEKAEKKKNEKVEQAKDTEELSKDQKNKIEEQLRKFKTSPQTSYSFPVTLNGLERKFVHEICERDGLEHKSEGEGQLRHIIVSKKNVSTGKEEMVDEEPKQTQSKKKRNKTKKTVEVAEEAVPSTSGNVFDNLLKDENSDLVVVEEKEEENNSPQVEEKYQLPKKIEKAPTQSKEDKERAEENLLKKAIKENKECGFGHCQRPLGILGGLCNFCGKKYCANHTLPEVHGCGDAAKKKARSTWLQNGKSIVTGTPPVHKPLKESERKVVKNILHSKLEAAAKERQGKKKK
eukprot:TRINITY_DN5852_c0_g1_i1.p1 TRINITY_DN5852_c0_g1~~TRINITY_DN5852_c0_g1_i1.p1  ORF type:complete len:864 (+),score=274.71 TRINITY_DN5852_c0_g1_i1:599-3190(+)